MKSLKQAGVSVSGLWSRWGLCFVLAAASAGCGGGSDPLDIGGGSSGEGGSGSVDLRAAYDRINQCGLTLQETRNLVGQEEYAATVWWEWYEERFSEKGKLWVGFNTEWEGKFVDTGVNRATLVIYEHPKNGVRLDKHLCDN